MTEIKTINHVLELARGLLDSATCLSAPEAAVLRAVGSASAHDVAAVRSLIEAGDDPLGDALCLIRSAEERRAIGAIYTPAIIVESIMAWSAAQCVPARVVDPGAGSGRFLLAAGKRFPLAQLVAIDTDPVALVILRANAAARGMGNRLAVFCEDYCEAALADIDGRTLYVGNPPYIRHHDIPAAAKEWFGRTAAALGFKASKLAGLHVYFFLRTRQIAKAGDFGAYITSSEWLDVNYGVSVREMLADGLGGVGLHVLAPSSMPFAATTTGAITCFQVGAKPEAFRVRVVNSISELGALDKGKDIPWAVASSQAKWSALTRAGALAKSNMIQLGELFRVHRGQVTGQNSTWVVGRFTGQLPERFLHRTVTKAKELFAAGESLDAAAVGRLKRVLDLPVDLSELEGEERKMVDAFIRWAKREGADTSYVASHRKAWWSVGLKVAPPILCTYMARRAPAFVLNPLGARHINVTHGLFPREPMSQEMLAAYASILRSSVSVDAGRTYAGGLTKFEPGEVERLLIPAPTSLALPAMAGVSRLG